MPDETISASHDQRFPTFLAGDTISLRSLEHTDLDVLCGWFADREVVRYSLSAWIFPCSLHETQTWLDATIHDKHTLTLGIVEHATDALIGFAGITSISLINRSGEYFILIGNKQCWSHGSGRGSRRFHPAQPATIWRQRR
jgi:RimJ/RimL family protein N-acetyltransferase